MLFVGTSIIHPSTEGVFLLCNILDLLIYSYIRDIWLSWYVVGINEKYNTIDALIRKMREETEGMQVITVGVSSGGFIAAILASSLKASYCLDFAGQFSLLHHWTHVDTNPFLKEHRSARYQYLVLTGKLTEHLNQVDKEVREKVEILMEQMAEQWGVTEELKMQDQMEWVRRLNNIQATAEEIALKEIIYL